MYKLVCFDLDGTLVDNITFSWQLFHDYFNIDTDSRKKAMDNFYSGMISYEEWARHDIDLWRQKKATKADFFAALEKVKPMKGSIEVLEVLKKNNFKIVLISGSLSVVLEKCFPNYKEIFDDIFISVMDFRDDGTIRNVAVTRFDMEKKAYALKQFAEKENVSLGECVFVGDHRNDLHIIQEVGLGIAFNCSIDALKEVADVVVETKDLREILKHIL